MKRMFVMATLLAVAVVIGLSGVAVAQRVERGGRGPGAMAPRPGDTRGDFESPPGSMGEFGGPRGAPGDGFGPGGGPPGPPHRPPSLEDFERAGVTKVQRARIEDVHENAMRRSIRLTADLRIAELDLRKVIESDDPAADAVDAAIDRVGGLRTMLHKTHVTEMLAVRALLTPEQRARLEKARAAPQRR